MSRGLPHDVQDNSSFVLHEHEEYNTSSKKLNPSKYINPTEKKQKTERFLFERTLDYIAVTKITPYSAT